LSVLSILRNARIGAGVFAGAAAGFATGEFIGGLSSGLIGGIAGADTNAGKSIWFPQELLENDHYIEFVAKQTNGVGSSFLDAVGLGGFNIGGSTTLGGTIRLPMPSQLSTDYNPEYSDPALGAAAGMALKPSDQAIYGNPTMGNQAMVGNSLQGVGLSLVGGALGAGLDKALGAVPKELGGANAAGALLKVGGGVAVNPHKIVLFTGVNFRTHQFSWKMSPKNRRESDAIRQIIEMFTYYSHPEYVTGGLFFKYPEFFEIKFRHPEYLFKLQPSVCKDIKVNYHGQGYPAYIRDANGGGVPAPAEVELSLTFMETEIVTKQSLNGVLKTPRAPITAPQQKESIGPIPMTENGPTATPGP
jgi:hypothetical protein